MASQSIKKGGNEPKSTDAIRYRRSDEALVRVIVDSNGATETGSEQRAIQFIQDLYQPLKRQIWSNSTGAALLP